MKQVTLNNGIQMPQLGLGIYQVANDITKEVVTTALDSGYRSIDTAQFYDNEIGVGQAIKHSNIPREELFVTTKVWNSHHGYEKTIEAFEDSLTKLQLDYIDLYLIHWPMPMKGKYVETYQALEKLYKDGRVKAIGVSNFHIEHLETILRECEIKPVLNQVECHPYFQQHALKDFCKKHDIYLEAWSPLSRGAVFDNEVIQTIASKYNKTAAQIILRWHIQENTIVIPKSITPSRIKENMNVFDFALTEEEMKSIYEIDKNERAGREPNEMDMI
ncbi:MAG TPA: aldo/keto reductase [Pseudogracilibacillus sp.]|nr:aldo/keto reductase [Pseudogracilibacillus sp.]